MIENKRVFITGLGALTACGANADETWNTLCTGKSGIEEIKQWDLSSWPCKIGGELKNFQPNRMLPDRKLLKAISRHDVIGINAAMQAVENSQLIAYKAELADSEEFDDNTGVFVGSPGNKYYQQYDFLNLIGKAQDDFAEFPRQLFNEVHPMWLLRILPNNVLAYTGIQYGFKGVNHNITNHAISGTQALIEAYQSIIAGHCERAIVVSYDVGIEPQALFYYQELGVLSATELRPFDAKHNGTVLAEGAAAIVLESEASVKKRKAVCHAEILGGFSTTEAMGLFAIEKDGNVLEKLIEKTLAATNLTAENIDCIIAHGNGNVQSDISEAVALKNVFKQKPPVTSFKWSLGHTLSASGLIDAVLTTYALKNQVVPGVAAFDELASNCNGINVSAEHRMLSAAKPNHALMINRGFASMNACLVIKSCE